MYPARVPSRIKCMILPNAHNNKIIVIDNLFRPTFLVIVYFANSARIRKIIGINIVWRNVLWICSRLYPKRIR